MAALSPTERFQAFLRIRSVSGEGPSSGAYRAAVDFLKEYAAEVGLAVEEIELVPNKPIVIASWIGSEPERPFVLANSHYDVVPAEEDKWTEASAWGGELKDGRIYGRGSQDMKCVPVMQLEAVRRLRAAGFQPRRTLRFTFVPDEEIGGAHGMGVFLASPHYAAMGEVGLALDEGLANPADAYTAFYGERSPWWIIVRATGNTGHASRFIADTAVSKLASVMQNAMAFRAEQFAELHGEPGHEGCSHALAKTLGDVTTLNVTMLQTGVTSDEGRTWALNVVPSEATMGLDIRIPPAMPMETVRGLLDSWASEEGVTWEFADWTNPLQQHFVTDVNPETNPWWRVFQETCEGAVGKPVETEVFPAATDSRFLREIGVRAIGFSPLNSTPRLLHDHNEYVDEEVFLAGIGVYEALFPALLQFEGAP